MATAEQIHEMIHVSDEEIDFQKFTVDEMRNYYDYLFHHITKDKSIFNGNGKYRVGNYDAFWKNIMYVHVRFSELKDYIDLKRKVNGFVYPFHLILVNISKVKPYKVIELFDYDNDFLFSQYKRLNQFTNSVVSMNLNRHFNSPSIVLSNLILTSGMCPNTDISKLDVGKGVISALLGGNSFFNEFKVKSFKGLKYIYKYYKSKIQNIHTYVFYYLVDNKNVSDSEMVEIKKMLDEIDFDTFSQYDLHSILKCKTISFDSGTYYISIPDRLLEALEYTYELNNDFKLPFIPTLRYCLDCRDLLNDKDYVNRVSKLVKMLIHQHYGIEHQNPKDVINTYIECTYYPKSKLKHRHPNDAFMNSIFGDNEFVESLNNFV